MKDETSKEVLFSNREDFNKNFKTGVLHYVILEKSTEKGFNRTVRLYGISKDDGVLLCVGECHYHISHWNGAKCFAEQIYCSLTGSKFNGTQMLKKSVKIYRIVI